MGIFKRNKATRANVQTLIPMENRRKGNYISPIIKHRLYDYYNVNHRVAVCKLDGKAERLTYKLMDRFTAKTFKFYSSHEIDGVEIMKEQRARWIELNANEIYHTAGTPFIRDGFVLMELINNGEEGNPPIDWNVYGEYESPPILWTRDGDNKIINYKIQFTPQPRAMGTAISMIQHLNSPNDNMKVIGFDLDPQDLIHVERGEPNWGLGHPLIESCWDPLIKLAGESHQEMLDKRSVPTLHLEEEDYDPQQEKAKNMLAMVANSDQDIARVWYHKRNPGTQETSDFPKFAYESPTANQEYQVRQSGVGVGSGDFGAMSKEWANLTTTTGHTIHYFIGNRAGAVVGSETDKDDDIEQEIVDFGLTEKIIRKILTWLNEQELITLPAEPFVIKYWRDWEKIEKEAKLKAEEKEKMAQTGGQPGDEKDEIDTQDNDPKPKTNEWQVNALFIEDLYRAIKENLSYKMTPVDSSWIDEIGYDDIEELVYMLLLDGKAYNKPAPLAEWTYLDWEAAGSPGRYFWDYLSQRDPPWQRATIPSHLNREYKEQETVKVPIFDYKLIDTLDTETKIKNLAKKINWGMGTKTATNIKKMLAEVKNNANKRQPRYNTMNAEAFGNSIKENYPLLYDIGDGTIVEEYICPESWAKNVGKIVPLGVYHNLEEYAPELPDWQIVGNAEIFGWDDETGEDYVRYDYKYEKINQVFKKLNEYDWLTAALNELGTSDISTAYYCDIEFKWNEALKQIIRVQTNIDLISISFVPAGNCPGEVCSIKEIARNKSAIQAYIKNCLNKGMEKSVCLAQAYKQFKAKI